MRRPVGYADIYVRELERLLILDAHGPTYTSAWCCSMVLPNAALDNIRDEDIRRQLRANVRARLFLPLLGVLNSGESSSHGLV